MSIPQRLAAVVASMSFRAKLMAGYFVVFVIPTVIAGIYGIHTVSQQAKLEALAEIRSTVERQVREIAERFTAVEGVASHAARSGALFRWFYLNLYGDGEYVLEYLRNVEPLIRILHESHQAISAINFITQNPAITLGNQFYRGDSYADSDWWEEMQSRGSDSEPVWEGPHESRSTGYGMRSGRTVVSLAGPIPPLPRTDATYFDIEVTPDLLFAFHENPTNSYHGFAAVIGPDGWYYAYTDRGISRAQAQDHFAELLRSENKATRQITIDGKTYIATVLPIGWLDAVIANVSLEADLAGDMPTRIGIIVLFSLIGLTALFLLSLFLSTLLVRRIRLMVTAIRSIHDEEFDIDLPAPGKDEIDELARDINRMSARIHELVNTVYKAKIAQRETELDALRAQVNPHFIYNILETLKMLAELHDDDEIAEYLTAFGHVLRYNTESDSHFTTIAKEISVVKDYVTIQNLLFDHRITLICSIDSQWYDLEVPSFILQPVVENSIMHGMPNDGERLKIELSVKQMEGDLMVSVHDNGRGAATQELADRPTGDYRTNASAGIGLSNIANRLKLYYGAEYGIEVSSVSSGGFSTVLHLPADGSKHPALSRE